MEQQMINPLPKRVLRAAVYARYSSEMQSSTSAKDQINRVISLAERDQIESRLFPGARVEIIEEWIQKDEAITGKIAGRAGYQKILQGLREKSFDILIVDDLSRLTRSLGNLLDLYQLLRHYDVELLSISDRVSSADHNAKTFFTVKGMVADFGNDAHSERTKRGLEARAREKFSTGVKPYGYESRATRIEKRKGKEVKSHFEIIVNQEEAEIVRLIYQTYADGYGKVYIAKILNQKGMKCPRVSTGWKPGIISKILKNEKYTGRWVYNSMTYSFDPETNQRVTKIKPKEEWIIHDRPDLRMITQDLWEEVQVRFKANEETRLRTNPGTKRHIFGPTKRLDNCHLLSGSLTCGDCGAAMVLVSGRRGGYYGCFASYNQGICKNRSLIRREKIEKNFLNYLREYVVKDPEVIQYATERYNEIVRVYLRKAPNKKRDLEKELQRVSSELSKLVQFILAADAPDLETIRLAIRERESSKARISEELGKLSNTEEKRFLITPYLVQHRLETIIDHIAAKGDRYNGIVKKILRGPLAVNKKNEETTLNGLLDIGGAMGASHCSRASPTGFEPVLLP